MYDPYYGYHYPDEYVPSCVISQCIMKDFRDPEGSNSSYQSWGKDQLNKFNGCFQKTAPNNTLEFRQNPSTQNCCGDWMTSIL